MDEPNLSVSTTRRRLPLWGGIAALILLFPAIVIPLLVSSFGETAFQSVDEIDVSRVKSMSILMIERPDGGPNIGTPNELFVIPESELEKALQPLRRAERVASESPRGIWLGRIVITLNTGRTQTVMLHRPKQAFDRSSNHRLELRIGRNQFIGPPVGEFLERISAIAGVDDRKE